MRISSRALRMCAVVSATALAASTLTPAHAATAGPKNIIYMIGDGMGYNHIAAANLYEAGVAKYQLDGEANAETLTELDGEAYREYETFNHLGMATFQEGNHYDPQAAWNDHDWVLQDVTDSAAAGTAMASGQKTVNGMLGVDSSGQAVENTSERAKKLDKAAGVVTSVPFSHATPAAWGAHNESRNNYHAIAEEMLSGGLDVVMGAGHPLYDDNGAALSTPEYKYISEETYNSVTAEDSDWNVVTDQADFESLAAGVASGDEQYFGLAPVASTLQQGRDGDQDTPYSAPRNNVVDLATMTTGALNVLGNDDEGFHLMVEGGAIDWAGHANTIGRDIEETIDFNDAVDAAIAWVEANSSWDETLLVITADHETGYLSGPNDKPDFSPLTGVQNEAPAHGYYSGGHTNQVVPFFYKGAGSEDITAAVTGTDPVRGDFIDNTTLANLVMDAWWTERAGDDSDDADAGSAEFGSSDFGGGSSVAVILSILAAIFGVLNIAGGNLPAQIKDLLKF